MNLPSAWLQARKEVDRWVQRSLSDRACLFTTDIAPSTGSLFDVLSRAHREGTWCTAKSPLSKACEEACRQVVGGRARLLGEAQPGRRSSCKGRWIAFDPGMADFCGLAADPGFVDEADAPAWDLWIAWCDGTGLSVSSPRLISWVPVGLVRRYEKAVECSVLGALFWVTDSELKALAETHS